MQNLKEQALRVLPIAMLLAVMAIMLTFIGDSQYEEQLRYQRALFSEQPWRLLTHAFIHINYQHFLLNASALALLFFLFNEAFKSFAWLIALTGSAIISATGLYFTSPDVEWCVGLSGALHGLIVYALLRTKAHPLWLFAIIGKIIAEQLPQLKDTDFLALTESFISATVVVDAHLWGAVGGLLLFILLRGLVWAKVLIEINSHK